MNYAIIGFGYIAPRHVDAIGRTGGQVLLAADPDKSARDKARSYGITTYSSHEFMEADPAWDSVDTVVVASPNSWHVPYMVWSRKKGKRVITEKPPCVSSRQLKDTYGLEKCHTVMQLRYHPEFQRMLEENPNPRRVSMYVKVKRDPSYWESWKGDETKSGGIAYNLGIHYFDALAQLTGTELLGVVKSVDRMEAIIGRYQVVGMPQPISFHLEIADNDRGQDRYVKVDGKVYRFCKQDNLSMEDLHVKVYEDLESQPHPKSLMKLCRMVDKIKYE